MLKCEHMEACQIRLGWSGIYTKYTEFGELYFIPTHSQSQYLAVRYFHVEHELTWRKTVSLWIINSGSIGDTQTSTCSYNRSGAASQAKGMLWLLTALKYAKDDLFPERISNVLFVIRKWCLNSYGKYLGTVRLK